MRAKRLLASAIAVAVASVLVACGDSSDGIETVVLDEPGEYQQPSIALNRDLDGESLETGRLLDRDDNDIDLAELTGRPLVVNFWFTDCPPCKREMPTLQSAHETHGDSVGFVGINSVDSRDRMLEFADDIGVTYELLRDPDGELLVANGIATFPTTLFVDANGIVVKQISGEVSIEVLTSAIEELLT